MEEEEWAHWITRRPRITVCAGRGQWIYVPTPPEEWEEDGFDMQLVWHRGEKDRTDADRYPPPPTPPHPHLRPNPATGAALAAPVGVVRH